MIDAATLPPADVVLTGHFTDADRMRYTHVPFVVPGDLHQLHIRYSYNDRIDSDPLISGGNTLDIGVFDPRGTATGSRGFRGWSGSNKLELVIGDDWATPPYAAGPVQAGTWHVLLGPYKVGPRGCDWRVEVRFDPGLPPAPPDLVRTGPARRAPVPAARDGWLRGDLHCHTRFSDGDSWPSEMLHAATEVGLEFRGVTDHNNVAHHAAYAAVGDADGPIVIPGVEVTTYGGHWNAWGTDRWWDFRTPEADAVERAMAEAVGAGAFVSVNHPKPFGPAWEYPAVRSFQAVEVWNGSWSRLNSIALAFWETRLRAGRRLVAVGGSDTHTLRSVDADLRHAPGLGTPTTWVHAGDRPDTDAVLGALRAGRTFISDSPAGPQLYLEPGGRGANVTVRDGAGTALVLVGEHGTIAAAAVGPDEWTTSIAIPRDTAYVRAQLVAENGDLRALTSPLWWRPA